MKKDNFGTRMKKYEYVTRNYLINKSPVIIRLDGKAFHTFTRGFEKPFDEIFVKAMQETMKYLCENIQGCVLGYTQSDEITLVLVDYKNINSCSWFDYNIQKCASISASMATLTFNRAFTKAFDEWGCENLPDWDTGGTNQPVDERLLKLCRTYDKALNKGAMFDSRVFNIPKEEVTNCILWRQLDATRNSIQMVGQANFSHKELQNKSCNQIQDMLFIEKNINWNNFPTHLKRGSCCIKNKETNKWFIDKEIPIFKGEGRKYIDDLIFIGE